jgi:G:T-mismatch repair DNA endonuclease (very short patch repair protein)
LWTKSSKDTNKIKINKKKEEKLEERMERDLLPLTFRYRWKDKQKEGGETNVILGLVGTVLSYHSMMMLNRRPWV